MKKIICLECFHYDKPRASYEGKDHPCESCSEAGHGSKSNFKSRNEDSSDEEHIEATFASPVFPCEKCASLEKEVERLTEMVRGDCNYCQVEWDNEMCYTCTVAFPKGGTENHWQLKENSDG